MHVRMHRNSLFTTETSDNLLNQHAIYEGCLREVQIDKSLKYSNLPNFLNHL